MLAREESKEQKKQKRGTYWAAHVRESIMCSGYASVPWRNSKGASNVGAEFHRYSNSHDKINKGDGIEGDVPEVHHATHAAEDEEDGEDDHQCCPQVKAQQHEGHKEDGPHAQGQVEDRVVHNGQVLLVEHIEHTAEQTENAIQ